MIAGLGNPGLQYETTRHNVGFLAIDRLIDRWNATKASLKYQSQLFTANVDGEKILLVKPQTFMNLSGRSVGPLCQFYQIPPEDLIVIHDDLDLPPLTLRLKTGGGAGGHNGLKSIDEHLGKDKNSYHRIRIGIGSPRGISEGADSRMDVADYVLQPFSKNELKSLDPVLDDVADAAEEIFRGKITAAMNKYHRQPPPQK